MMHAQIMSDKGPKHFDPEDIEFLVIHAMGEFIDTENGDYSAHDYLRSKGDSCNYMVTPSGVIIKCRDEDQGAYHAREFNRKSIGIEILCAGVHDYYTFLHAIKSDYIKKEQYRSLVQLCRDILVRFPKIKLVRHSDIAPARKYDPGVGLDWEKFRRDVYESC